jgi:hypothetical protein
MTRMGLEDKKTDESESGSVSGVSPGKTTSNDNGIGKTKSFPDEDGKLLESGTTKRKRV